MTEGAIFVRGPGRLLPGEQQKSAAATEALRAALAPISDQFGGVATTNALSSVWLDHMLRVLGPAETDVAMRLLRRDLPRPCSCQGQALAAAQRPTDQVVRGLKAHGKTAPKGVA